MKTVYKALLLTATTLTFASTAMAGDYHTTSKTNAGYGYERGTPRSNKEANLAWRNQYDTLNNREVSAVQRSLKNEGYRVAVDGVWGNQTTSAIRAFQRRNGLPATGDLDSRTLSALDVNVNRSDNRSRFDNNRMGHHAEKSRSYNNEYGQHRSSGVRHMSAMRMSNSQVRDVQQSLRQEGYRVSVDGIWGPNTRNALRDFQDDNGIAPTGMLDRETMAELDLNTRSYSRTRSRTRY